MRNSEVDGVLAAGTTGEFIKLEPHERLELFRISLDVLGQEKTIAHIGSDSLEEAVTLTKEAQKIGATRLAAITPRNATFEEVHTYYQAIANVLDGGVELNAYLFERTRNTYLSPKDLTRVGQIDGITGAKISGCGINEIRDYRAALPDEFRLYTGKSSDITHAHALGCGVVSGEAGALPAPFVQLVKALMRKNSEAQSVHQNLVDQITHHIKGAPRIKYALALLGITRPEFRVTQKPLADHERDAIQRVVDAALPYLPR